MSLETGTWVQDLDPTNPPGTDKKKQGDDHLRLIKIVLKTTFPNASKAFYLPAASASQSGNFSVLAADMNKTFMVDTTSLALVATLPVLAAGDAGWECSFIKTNTGVNAFFIAPTSGTIQSGEVAGLTRTRRCIPGHRTKVLWTGSAWIAERVTRLPLGAIIDCPIAALPVGYEWANGQTLGSASTNYPDFNTVNGSGTIQDRRGRVAPGRDDMGGSVAGRITNSGSGIVGTTLGAAAGFESRQLAASNVPQIPLDIPAGQGSHLHATPGIPNPGVVAQNGVAVNGINGSQSLNSNSATLPAMTGTANTGVTAAAFPLVQPSIITNMIAVVE